MRPMLIAAGFLAASLGLSDAVQGEVVFAQAARGKLEPPGGQARNPGGKFSIVLRDTTEGPTEELLVQLWKLDFSREEGQAPHSYRVFLLEYDGEGGYYDTEFGEVTRSTRRCAFFHLLIPPGSFPGEGGSLRNFGGGRIEVRDVQSVQDSVPQVNETVVLEGDIPDFVYIGQGNDQGSGAAAWQRGESQLQDPREGGYARGRVRAAVANRPAGEQQAVRVEGTGLFGAPATGVFTVVVLGGEGGDTTLGTMTVRPESGLGTLDLNTRRGDEVAAPGVRSMGNRTVEVRDELGNVFLTGRFPVLQQDE